MEITSFDFLFYVLGSLTIYYLLPRQLQNAFLLLASYYYYYTWQWNYVYILAGITLFNFMYAKLLLSKGGKRTAPLWLGVMINLLIFTLFIFGKPAGSGISELLSQLGNEGITVRLLLPIGFSYYILESISYLVDVKRKQLKATSNLIDFSLYLVYFPKLISGPIERAPGFLKQLSNKKVIDNESVAHSIALVLIGLLRTLVFANTLLFILPETAFSDPLTHSNLDLVIWLLVYGMILYNQFAGYTNIVRGVSGLFGIKLSANFAQP
ncbi:MAG: hypothetical protein N2D54_09835, partial [Chloroflexota bacterium]